MADGIRGPRPGPPRGETPGSARPLRILLAHDLSPRADRATALIAASRWPVGSIVRVVTSPTGLGLGISSFAGAREIRAHHRDLRRAIEGAHQAVTTALMERGLTVETVVADGPAAGAIIEDAGRFAADLIVVGAREQGQLAAALLGSVPTEILDGAPCSVLISRGPPLERVLLATDGSQTATAAVDIVASWPMFAAARLRVLGVTDPPPRYAAGVLSEGDVGAAYQDTVAASRATTEEQVAAVVEQLTAAGREVEGRVRSGDPHAQIVGAARDWRADLVVIGATGQSPLRAILLGSVARRILHRVSSSVLVARRPVADRDGRPSESGSSSPGG